MSRPFAVITEPFVATCDTACVDACPVDCIHGPLPLAEIRAISAEARRERLPGIQLFVNPNECIGCWACVPVCPVSAIFSDDDVPEEWKDYIALNAAFFERPSL
jgi:NAD-dependent dihydropyrimidine dehydrogenase PreA subunit